VQHGLRRILGNQLGTHYGECFMYLFIVIEVADFLFQQFLFTLDEIHGRKFIVLMPVQVQLLHAVAVFVFQIKNACLQLFEFPVALFILRNFSSSSIPMNRSRYTICIPDSSASFCDDCEWMLITSFMIILRAPRVIMRELILMMLFLFCMISRRTI